MDRFNKTIQVKPQQNYHQEQFDLYGRQERVEQGKDRGGDRGRGGRDRAAGGKRPDEQPAQAAVKDEG
jgi:ribonuclease G